MNIERLKLMVTLLREVAAGTWKSSVMPTFPPPKLNNQEDLGVDFDIRTWVRGSVKEGCGYAACAVGHACLDSRFNEQGLYEQGGIPRFKPPVQDTEFLFNTCDWKAVLNFFGLDMPTTEWLFSGDSYDEEGIEPTPENVAQRIEAEIAAFLAKQGERDDQLLQDLQS